jgi:hypothetical protein
VSAADTVLTPPPGYNLRLDNATIEVKGLRKRFGRIKTLNDVSFSVWPAQVSGSSARWRAARACSATSSRSGR